jgi:hypothetical protein
LVVRIGTQREVVTERLLKKDLPHWAFFKAQWGSACGIPFRIPCYEKMERGLRTEGKQKETRPREKARQDCSVERCPSHEVARLPSTFLIVMKSLRPRSVTI